MNDMQAVLAGAERVRKRLGKLEKAAKGRDVLSVREEVQRFTEFVRALPPRDVVTFQKVQLGASEELQDLIDDLRAALVEKGYRVL